MKRIFLLSLPLLAACGPAYGTRVPDRLVQRLPYETRIELLEAENDLALAIDKVDESASEIVRARDNIRRAKSRLAAAEDEEDRAADNSSREVARLAIEESEARVDYLRARQRLNVGLLDVEKLALRCAFARFELARLTAARKAKVEGSEALEPKDFEEQVAECDADVKEERADLAEDLAEEKAARQAWEVKKAALAKKTFDARASPYVEAL
ncbi:hypothetical protein P2318_06270 [Myxococcaceae bacterium GXIMD 01537]